MAYEPLHHKYRPQTFAELVGQAAIATTLTNALRQQKIAPAYLFTGARGTGKTSSARILAKSLNCLQSSVPTETPCGVCEVCRSIANGSALDVIEIDAASNTGVDNIRELIERAQFAPVQCRYKVYCIDECHMLSNQAFNALLKTLEEPPERVVFVLATTDPQRVLPTIISRCQRFDFRRIELEAMVHHLSRIADKEAIDVSPDAIQLVAQIAQGGLRDAQSMLDQLSLLEGRITVERVWDLVGAVPERDLLALVQALTQSDITAVIEQVRRLLDRGREPLIVLQNLASFYRDLLIAKTTPNRNDLVAITPPTWAEMCRFVQAIDLSLLLKGQTHLRESEIQIKNTTQPRLWLEVTLMGLLPTEHQQSPTSPAPFPSPPPPVQLSAVEAPIPPPPVRLSAVEASSPPLPSPSPPASEEPAVPETVPAILSLPQPDQPEINLEQMWQSIIEVLQPPGTQALFRQQGRLLTLEAEKARIGISSQPLFKMAQQRVANLEAAFAKVAHPVKVSLEVVHSSPSADASPSANSSPAATVPPSHSLGNLAAPESRPISTPMARETHHPGSRNRNAGTSNGNHSDHSTVADYGAVTDPPLSYNANPANPTLVTSSQPPAWQEEDEVSRAAKSLAQMFNGQIVKETDELEVLAPETLSRGQVAALQPDVGDPDDDVPF
ncbi:DNA polymerase III subunit gamma/tau [Leptolyngbya sp. NK1-12]|uniref:DNA polymerase III subunit gamma/tau n=1 Tax=Leptolyngbya sp. NK1-12 TaxID=2547451 RepID=A0AA97AL41_9CYAN|nr:DNA polymerase III subunit gamma/tau [Leptolyngbya sp. NK1-12]WNZ24242.1 DNA polymerase III subunit gamma/tau [Leptolyngbya sp. NK1-12]